MGKYQDFDHLSQNINLKPQYSKLMDKEELFSLFKKVLWLKIIPHYTKEDGIVWLHYDIDRLKYSIKNSKNDSNELTLPLEEFNKYTISTHKLSKTQKYLNKIHKLNKNAYFLEDDKKRDLNYWQKHFNNVKYLLKLNTRHYLNLEKLLSRADKVNIENLIPWLELELNTFYDYNLPYIPSSFLIKYNHLYRDSLASTLLNKDISENTRWFLYGLTGIIDTNYPESLTINKILEVINKKLLPELVYLFAFEDFELHAAINVLQILERNKVIYKIFQEFRPSFISFAETKGFIFALNGNWYWLDKTTDPFKEQIKAFFKLILILTHSQSIINDCLSFIRVVFTCKINYNPEDAETRENNRQRYVFYILNLESVEKVSMYKIIQ